MSMTRERLSVTACFAHPRRRALQKASLKCRYSHTVHFHFCSERPRNAKPRTVYNVVEFANGRDNDIMRLSLPGGSLLSRL